MFSAVGMALAGRPIPNGKDVYTSAKLNEELRAYRLGLLDRYEKCTKDPPDRVKEVAEFHRKLFDCSQEVPGALDWKQLDEIGDKLLAQDEADPLVLSNIGLVKLQLDKADEAKSIFIKAIANYAGSSYPARSKFSACHRLRSVFVSMKSPVEAWEPYSKDFHESLLESMTEISEEPENRRLFWIGIEGYVKIDSQDESNNYTMHKSICNAVEKAEKVDPWIKNMVLGWYYKTLGWKKRGHGYANSVTNANMQAFHENLAKAKECFTKAWEIDPKPPEAAAAMIEVSLSVGDEELSPRDWFDRAVAAQMDYDPAYGAFVNSQLPRWRGSHEKMYEFGLECLATKRFDTSVPEKLIQILMDIDNELDRNGEIWQEEGVFEKVKEVIEGVAADPCRQKDPKGLNPISWNNSAFCLIAAHTKRYDEARQMLDKMGGRLREGVFLQFSMRFPFDLAKIYALTGDARDESLAFESLVADGNYRDDDSMKEAREQLEKAAAKDSNSLAKPFFDYWKTRLDWQERFDKGEWVDLTFDKFLLMWDTRQGSWMATDDGRGVVGVAESNGGKHQLKCTVPFDSAFEIECDIDCLEPDKNMLAGVMLGNLWYSPVNEPGCLFSVSFEQKAAYFTGNANHWPERIYLADQRKCRLRIEYWHDFFEYFVDGQFITPQSMRQLPDRKPIYLAYQNGKAQYRNLRIRKLAVGPPPATDKHAERLAYFEEAIQRDPQNAYAYFERGIANKGLGRQDEGLADYYKAGELAPSWAKPWYFIAKNEYQLNHYRESLDAMEKYSKLLDDNPAIYLKMAAILSTAPDDKVRDGKLAVEKAEKACQLMGGHEKFDALQVLAAAHAEAGNFEDAEKWASKAIELAPDQYKNIIRHDLELFKAKKPVRMKPLR
jgi:tetratricopeptide (TPR) repeat protein